MQSKTFLVVAVAMLLSLNTFAQSPASGTINGHEYVDLGLSVKWATCNVGAENPEDYGDYFAWGEAETKPVYTKENSTTYGKDNYTFHDAATEIWGDTWRMPTKAEFQELINNCKWQWTTVGDHEGYKVKSKKNGNSIFFPAAGSRYANARINVGDWGDYWSSSPYESDSESAYHFFFCSTDYYVEWEDRNDGMPVRPVSE